MTRGEWLEARGVTEDSVFKDGVGEYIRGKIEVSHNVTSFPKVYLPDEFQNHG